MEIIKLNLIPSGVNPTCHCSQYDNGRVIRIDLFDGLTPYVLQSGDTVTLNVRKPDNHIVTTTLTATQGNTYVNLVTTEQICACVGYNLCDLTITNGTNVIGTLNFIMQIERDVLADGIPSQSVIEDLDELVAEAVGDNYYTKAQTDNLLNGKADTSTTYTKTQVDSALALKANTSDVNSALASKADESEVVAINDTLSVTVEHKESVNALDINTIVRGTLGWNGVVTESPSADYYVTPFISAESGDFVHYITSGTETTIQRISLYNANKTFIENVNSVSTYEITNSNAKFVRLQLYKTVINPIRAMVCITDSSTTPAFEWCYKPYTKTIGTRPRVDLYAEDGINNFWLNMQEAFYKGDCDVYIHKGEYVYTNDLVDKIRSLNRRGVPIGNGCRYYFETGANITCNYTGDNVADVAGYFSPLDSWNIASDFEIYNLSLVAKNTVYAVHDEANGEETSIKHIYKDCYISIDNTALGASSSALSKCIGGGFGLHSEIIIENCVFSTINPNTEHGEDVSYHKANNQTYTDAKMIVTGCYFGGKLRLDFDYSPVPHIISKAIICGNNAIGISAYQWDSKIWNNIIRT